MTKLFSKKYKRYYLILFLAFVVLFLFRLGYGYTLDVNKTNEREVYFENFSSDKKNYATKDFKSEKFQAQQDMPASVPTDQKYEKIAKVNATTHTFDSDEEKVRNAVEANYGIVQYERKTGNDGKRKLQLQIGVPPDNFDSLYNFIIKIGEIKSKDIIKNDKTNEYLQLNARKASLEKSLVSLIEFKEKGGKIDEYINLENRILEIEENLQRLGVNLGDFDESNAFCTIQFSLAEVTKAKVITVSFYHRVKVALEWTIAFYLRLIGILFFVVVGVFCLVFALDKRHVITDLFKPKK